MENFKLDLSKLTPIPEEYRVKGNWYVVADSSNGSKIGAIIQYHSSNRGMDLNGEQSWSDWKYWFAIPPNLPGFPVAELPDEFEIKNGEWEYYSDNLGKWRDILAITGKNEFKCRRKPKPQLVPTLVIPAGTVEERKKRLQEELEKLNK